MLYAIRNGGFSGAIMPQNIVVGEDAKAVADFVAEYAGRDATEPPGPVVRARSRPEPTLDLKLIRSDPEGVKAALERRGAGAAVDELLELDRRRRELLPQVEDRRAQKKRVSEEIAAREA